MTETRSYRQLWRIVDGAVSDALNTHPEYLTNAGRRSAARSITKRVTGSVLGYAAQAARGRSGARPAADKGRDARFVPAAGGAATSSVGGGTVHASPKPTLLSRLRRITGHVYLREAREVRAMAISRSEDAKRRKDTRDHHHWIAEAKAATTELLLAERRAGAWR